MLEFAGSHGTHRFLAAARHAQMARIFRVGPPKVAVVLLKGSPFEPRKRGTLDKRHTQLVTGILLFIDCQTANVRLAFAGDLDWWFAFDFFVLVGKRETTSNHQSKPPEVRGNREADGS